MCDDYKILSTGSHGNATILKNMVLVDCGVPFNKLGNDYKKLKLILLTHIH
jgi:glyoxylase-like metal-dependent hydrolase (beta-lactamase superfamily II)